MKISFDTGKVPGWIVFILFVLSMLGLAWAFGAFDDCPDRPRKALSSVAVERCP